MSPRQYIHILSANTKTWFFIYLLYTLKPSTLCIHFLFRINIRNSSNWFKATGIIWRRFISSNFSFYMKIIVITNRKFKTLFLISTFSPPINTCNKIITRCALFLLHILLRTLIFSSAMLKNPSLFSSPNPCIFS